MRHDMVRFLRLLDRGTHLRLVAYVIGAFLVSLADLLGVALVLPLVEILTGADLESGYLGVINRAAGRPERDTLLVIVAAALVVAFVAKAAFSLVMTWYMGRFYTRLQVEMSDRIARSYLSEPYLRHRTRDFPEIHRGALAATQASYSWVLGGLLTLIELALSIILVMGLLVVIMPIPSLVAAAYFGVAVFVLQFALKRRAVRLGEENMEAELGASAALADIAYGFREIRMHNASGRYGDRFRRAADRSAETTRILSYFTELPKYLLEVIVIIGVGIVVLVLAGSDGTSGIVASLAIFVAAAIRILPSFVRLTATLGIIRGGHAGLRILLGIAEGTGAVHAEPDEDPAELTRSPQTLTLSHVGFTYPDGGRPVLDDVSLEIEPGSSVAFCGASGSGKTTLVDVVLGLIPPDRGSVRYGQVDVLSAPHAWHDRVGYVPQDAFLQEATVAENVAFGQDPATIDRDRVRTVLSLARLDSLIDDLPGGMDTQVGERGVRFSGGQRQRVGIARALYRDPEILVLDEATSALDNETESEIARMLTGLRGEVTTILVAHRLSTVRHVDSLIYLENGRVTSAGTFEEVQARSTAFSRLVSLGRLE